MTKRHEDRFLVSHEVPKSLFKDSLVFNDYEYCLVHLCEDPEYLQFYIDASKSGRMVYLDNSVFELGASVGLDYLIKYAKLINPSHIIAPDIRNDGMATIDSLSTFIKRLEEENIESNVIAVAQGRDERDFFECYRMMVRNAKVDIIAIPFHIDFYNNYIVKNSETYRYSVARMTLINRLIKSEYINRATKHHLLGCSDPVEFRNYANRNKYSFIYSVDTSCPVICAIFNKKLTDCGLGGEPKIKDLLANHINDTLTAGQLKILWSNVEIFKTFITQDDLRETEFVKRPFEFAGDILKPKKVKNNKGGSMSEKFELAKKDGTTKNVAFTKKRGEILELLKTGVSKKDIAEKGYSPNTINVVASQAKKLGLLGA